MQKKFDKNLNNILQKNGYQFDKKIAVALSGGSDSMSLALLVNNFAKKHGLKLITITVDHGLRKGSDKEALKVQSWMNFHNIESVILTHKGKIPKSNIEAVAREYRYGLIKEYCDSTGISDVLVGHNLNEKTETFYLNLIRGSGIYGLAGVQQFAKRNDLTLIRPMMIFTKKEIKSHLKSVRQKWVEDKSNKDEKYLRVKIRKLKSIFKKLGLEESRIVSTIDNLNRTRETIEFYTNQALENCIEKENGLTVINVEKYKKNPEEIQLRFLAEILKRIGKKDYSPRMEKLQNLHKEILNNFDSKKAMTLNNVKLKKYRNNYIELDKEK